MTSSLGLGSSSATGVPPEGYYSTGEEKDKGLSAPRVPVVLSDSSFRTNADLSGYGLGGIGQRKPQFVGGREDYSVIGNKRFCDIYCIEGCQIVMDKRMYMPLYVKLTSSEKDAVFHIQKNTFAISPLKPQYTC